MPTAPCSQYLDLAQTGGSQKGVPSVSLELQKNTLKARPTRTSLLVVHTQRVVLFCLSDLPLVPVKHPQKGHPQDKSPPSFDQPPPGPQSAFFRSRGGRTVFVGASGRRPERTRDPARAGPSGRDAEDTGVGENR